MDEQQIQQMIDSALNRREQGNQYAVTPIPSHVHNGTDSQPIDYGNLTNAPTVPNLPVSVANGGTGATSLTAHGVLIGNGTGVIVAANAGTSGQVLTSNGGSADPTFQNAPGFKAQITTNFDTLTNYEKFSGGAAPGNVTRSTNGLEINSSVGAANGYAYIRWHAFQGMTGASNTFNLFGTNFEFNSVFAPISLSAGSTKGTFFAGIGNLTIDQTTIDFTSNHIGFKLVSDGTFKRLYGTQADGSTETQTVLTTFGDQDALMVYLKVNASTSVDYWYNLNNTGWNSTLGVTTNFPTSTLAANTYVQVGGSTINNNNVNQIFVQNATVRF